MKEYYLVDGIMFDSLEAVREYREGKLKLIYHYPEHDVKLFKFSYKSIIKNSNITIMTRFELEQLVCTTLDCESYRIGLQYEGKNHISQRIMDMLDCYSDNKVLSEKEVDDVDEWLTTYEVMH